MTSRAAGLLACMALVACRERPAPPAPAASAAPVVTLDAAPPASSADDGARASEAAALAATRRFALAASRGDAEGARRAASPECLAGPCGALVRAHADVWVGDKTSVTGARAVTLVRLPCDAGRCLASAHLERPCNAGAFRVAAFGAEIKDDADWLLMGMLEECDDAGSGAATQPSPKRDDGGRAR